MSINARQSHSGEHLVAKKAVCNPEICLEKKRKKETTSTSALNEYCPFQAQQLSDSAFL